MPRSRDLPRLLASLLALLLVGAHGLSAQAQRQNGASDGGMVSAAQPLATEAGVRMLELGGNAADAAVAAGFAIAVVEPTMNSIGGRNQILVRLPDGRVVGIDGTTQAPWDYDYDEAPRASYGYPVIGVPGAAAGLLKLHREHGSLPLETVMAPAIDYAENGFRLLPNEAARHGSGMEQGREFFGTAAVYLEEDGTAYDGGDLLVQKDYARTLRAVAEGGHDAFYRGAIAQTMAADLAAHGSAVKLEAFHDYEALDAGIVRGSYRGYDIVGLDVPAAGTVVIQALNVLEGFDPGSMSEAEWAAVAGQAIGLASPELRATGTDTARARALSKEWADRVRDQVRAPAGSRLGDGRADGAAAAGEGMARSAAERTAGEGMARSAGPTAAASAGLPLVPALDPRGDGQGHTTHLTTADGDGMMVALTQTLGPNMGSKVVTPGLGFLYASTLGGYLGRMEPGQRASSFISPVMVFRDGEPILALGAAGGSRIVAGVTQVISRMIDQGMTLAEALEAPRVFQTDPGELDAETSPVIGWTEAELDEMRALDLEIRTVERDGAFSRVHAVAREDGAWRGGADPDWEGSARGPGR